MENRSMISRQRYLNILQAGLHVRQFRFARLAALDWLAAYPGDLTVGLYYAQALVGEGRLSQALPILEGLRRADPEFVEAIRTLADAKSEVSETDSTLASQLFALIGRSHDRSLPATWGGALWLARQAALQSKPELADEMLRDAIRQAPDEPLVQVFHLEMLRKRTRIDPQTGCDLARRYLRRSPDCLAVMIHLAGWLLEDGKEDEAVAYLHQVAARDVGAQVVRRVWHGENPYHLLWPEEMQLGWRLSLPAEVSAALGWNRLPPARTAYGTSDTALMPEAPFGFVAPVPLPQAPIEPVAPPAAWVAPVEPIAHTHAAEAMTIPVFEPAAETGFEPVLEPEPRPDISRTLPEIEAEASESPVADLEDTRPTSVVRNSSKVADRRADLASELYWALAGDETASFDRTLSRKPAETPAVVARSRLAAIFGAERTPVKPPAQDKQLDPDLKRVRDEMDGLAARLRLPVYGHMDGRFPVYVVFSLRKRLEEAYGASVAALLQSEMEALAQAVSQRRGWSATVILADDPASLGRFGLSPVRSADAWDLKLLLADLDAALGRRGQAIGALLIVGGSEIVPFHRLPNPVDDQDMEVASDNPYATRNENYLVSEWPVGRLPGGVEGDARLLLDCLHRIRQVHEAGLERLSRLQRLSGRLRAWLRRKSPALSAAQQPVVTAAALGLFRGKPVLGRRLPAFGYTAEVWKNAAAQVYRPIGRPNALHLSPPKGFDGSSEMPPAAAVENCVPRPAGRLAYFNLHGLIDGPEWFGQRDPANPTEAPDFPVALRPEDVLRAAEGTGSRSGDTPLVVFSQACYGLSIQACPVERSMALSFLQAGSLAVIGSTGMSYGAITSPLAAGDLLALSFWRNIQAGMPAGESLRQAKIQLIADMDARQGFLDGEEQKTLISFALYGDPLALPVAVKRLPKSVRYGDSPLLDVQTVCDRAETMDAPLVLPPEVITSVNKVVSRYLPGMADAALLYARQRPSCSGEGHICPTSGLDGSAAPQAEPVTRSPMVHKKAIRREKAHSKSKNGAAFGEGCSLVTLSKLVHLPTGQHARVARLTLDEAGNLVKLVVSR